MSAAKSATCHVYWAWASARVNSFSAAAVFVAQVVKPQARVFAEARGFRVVEVDYEELRGMRADELRLF